MACYPVYTKILKLAGKRVIKVALHQAARQQMSDAVVLREDRERETIALKTRPRHSIAN